MRSQNCEEHILALLRLSVRLSVRMKQLGYIPPDRFVMKFVIFLFFEKPVDKNSSFIKTDQNNGTLHEDGCVSVGISRWILLMRSVADKICRENQYTHFMLQ
jgi:hypothetical protein